MNYSFNLSDLVIQGCSNEPTQINDNIYLGNKNASKNKDFLISSGITHIVRIGYGLKDYYPDSFTYYSIRLTDNSYEKIYPYFEKIFQFVEECIIKSGKILFHCYAGISRSTTLVCAYLMKKHSINFDSAISIIREKRRVCSPNSGFVTQLNEWYIKCCSNFLYKNRKYKNKNHTLFKTKKERKLTDCYICHKRLGRKKPLSIKIQSGKVNKKQYKTESTVFTIYSHLHKKIQELNSINIEDKVKKINTIKKNSSDLINELFITKKNLTHSETLERNKYLRNIIFRTCDKYIKSNLS